MDTLQANKNENLRKFIAGTKAITIKEIVVIGITSLILGLLAEGLYGMDGKLVMFIFFLVSYWGWILYGEIQKLKKIMI